MSPLGEALVKKVFSVYLALAVGLTMIQVSLDYRDIYSQVLGELDSTGRSFEPGVADAIWNYQGELIDSIARGIVNGRVIVAVEIKDISGRIHVRLGDKRRRIEELNIVKQFRLFHATRKGGRETIGSMTLYSSHGIIIERVKFSVMLIILNALLKTIGLWLIIVYFANRLLAAPLRRFTQQMGKVDPSRDMPASRIELGPVQSTELVYLQDGFNALMERTVSNQQQLQQLTISLEERVMQRTLELRASEKLLRNVADHLPALVCCIDRERCFRFVNRAFESWYQRPISEICGNSVREIIGAAHYEAWRSYLDLALQGMQVEFEFDMEHDGAKHYFKGIFVPQFDEQGDVNGICGLSSDVTGMKKITEEYRQRKLEAENANASKSRFLAAASHDLRQPLHALGLLTANLKSAPDEGLRQAILGQIERVLEGMDSEFHALLDVSRLDAGIIKPEPCNFSVNDLLDCLTSEYGGQAAAKGLRLTVRPSPLIVHSDPVLMGQVLRNLLSNAIKHSERGHITVGCRRVDGQYCALNVIDTGPGIPESERENVFQEFYQLKNPYHDRSKGLGLGLAIVRRITRLLGCELSLHSRFGRGTMFQVRLPISSEASTQKITAQIADLSNACFSDRFVVVLDDDRYILENTTRLLEDWGCAVIAATNYQDLEVVLGQKNRVPDLVLFDYTTCNHETGVELAHRLQQKYIDRPLPIMILTGETSPEKLADLRASGFHLLTKPVRPARLRIVIGRIFEEGELTVLLSE